MSAEWKMSKGEVAKSAIVIIAIAAYFLWRATDKTTAAKLVLSEIKNVAFHGKVDSIYRDKSNHNAKEVKLTTGYVYSLYPAWESKVAMGDSLIKSIGTTYVLVIKGKGKRIVLDYNEVVKYMKN